MKEAVSRLWSPKNSRRERRTGESPCKVGKAGKKQSISSCRKPPKNTRRGRETRAEAISERRWVVNTLSQQAGRDIQIPKRPAPAKRLSSTGLYLKGRQRLRRAVLFAGPPDTTFFIFSRYPRTDVRRRSVARGVCQTLSWAARRFGHCTWPWSDRTLHLPVVVHPDLPHVQEEGGAKHWLGFKTDNSLHSNNARMASYVLGYLFSIVSEEWRFLSLYKVFSTLVLDTL